MAIFLPVLVSIAGLMCWLALYLLWGREYQEHDPPQYLREPPEGWKPNEVGFLWKWGKIGPQDMTAMLMDLVRRGALRLVMEQEKRPRLYGLLGMAVGDEQFLERVADFKGELSPSEQCLILEILFRERAPHERVSVSQIAQPADKDWADTRIRYMRWVRLVRSESQKVPLMDPKSRFAMSVGLALGVVMLLSFLPVGLASPGPFVAIPAGVGLAMMFSCSLLRRRSREAAVALHRWQAFRRYLTDFSRLGQVPAVAVSVWEQYLVFAVTLRVAQEVAKQFHQLGPQVEAAENLIV